MECFNCNKIDECIEQFYVESMPCPHCSEEIKVLYYLCLDCGAVWKLANGEIVTGAVFSNKELESAIGDDLDNLFDILAEDKFFKGEYAKDMDMKEYLSNFIPKCIRCEARAYQIDDLTYRCSDPECEFEWEVVDLG